MTQKEKMITAIKTTISKYEDFRDTTTTESGSIKEMVQGIGYKGRCLICKAVNDNCNRCPIGDGYGAFCTDFASYKKLKRAKARYLFPFGNEKKPWKQLVKHRIAFWKKVLERIENLPDRRFHFRKENLTLIGANNWESRKEHINFPELHTIIKNYIWE